MNMGDLHTINSYYDPLLNDLSHLNQEKSLCHGIENGPCHGIENVSIIVNKKRWKKREKHSVIKHSQQPTIAFRLSRFSKYKKYGSITNPSSMPELNKYTRPVSPRSRSGHGKDTKQNKYKKSSFQSKFIANVVSEHRFDNCFMNLFNYPSQTKWKIYRCQLGAVEDTCCCSCNSDAMFEVMKGLYDCYKAQNCDNCCCVLCNHKLQEERKLGELRKSIVTISRDKVLNGKTAADKEKLLNEMVKLRQPLPAGKTASEKALIEKIRKEHGLPPSPKNAAEKAKMRKAEAAGIITTLEGKTPAQKEDILRAQANLGLPLAEGRTPSETALIAKIKTLSREASIKTADILTPLTGKSPEQKEKILRARAMKGLPLPEAQSLSEKKLVDKVRGDLGLPMEPKTKSIRDKHEQAAKAGLLQPLEGKTPTEKEKTLQGLHELGIPLPEGRTPSEKALIAKTKASTRAASIKTAGIMTPLTGKSSEQKEKILRARAMKGLPLPEAQSLSEKKLVDKVRADLGLPMEPKTKSIRDKHEQAAKAGLLQPLEGKTPTEKEKTLQGLHELGIPLPEGRTSSEKALIAKVKASTRAASIKTAGIMTPLTGKSSEQKEKILRARAMKGLPLPEAQSLSEKKLVDKVRGDLGLPMEPKTKSIRDKHEQAAKAGLLQPLEGKTPTEKEKTLQGLHELGIPLPEGRTPSEKALIAKTKASTRAASIKTAGIMTPLTGKSSEQKEKILRARAMKGLPLPEAQSLSEKKLVDKVRGDLGLPMEPKTKSIRDKHEQAAKAGLLQPLEGKTPTEKEKTLQGLHELGIPLPEGRTPSEKALIAKTKASTRAASIKTAGIMTPLTGKSSEQKEKILRARAMKGLPLPEAQSPSEKILVDKVRADLGLPMEPKTKSIRDKHEQAAKAGLLQPLEGKTPAEKEKILKTLHDLGITLPEGRTPSEKALIAKIKALSRAASIKTAGIMTPLTGKSSEQREKILRARAMKGLPLPEAQSPSEKILVDKVRADLGLPMEPKTKSIRDKHEQAAKAGLLQPLEGKTPAEKEKILKTLHDLGITLPEGRTPSEKALIAKIKALSRAASIKTAGIMTPLTGKSPEQKEKILRARAMKGLPLPEAQSPSEKILVDKVRADLGLPMEPKTKSIRDKHEQAAKAGLLQPLEGKTPAEKVKILKSLHSLGIPLPEGRTPSEKALIAKVKGSARAVSIKTAGIMTPLTGKPPEQKEKILRARAMKGLPLPEAQSPSEKILVDKVCADLGLPMEPETKSIRDKHEQAAKAGLLQPLEGKTPAEKEKILKSLHNLGIPLPEGRTPSEKALIANIKGPFRAVSIKTAGIMTPLTGKPPEQKEKILRARAMKGLPLPEAQSPSEKILVDKVRADLGLPMDPETKSIRDKHEQAAKVGLLQPLEGKTPAEKEKILKNLHNLGIPLPEGRTPSEKALIAKIAAGSRLPSKVASTVMTPSEQMRRAKAEGLLTTLKDKTPEQREKVLRALANRGIPLPEGQSPSEKKLIDKVRADLGLPIEPKNKAIRDKHEKAALADLLFPLEGKTPAQKEKLLRGQHNIGIPLPVGRTPSEKSLIAKIAAGSRPPSKVASAVVTPTEQMRRAKVEGSLTPLTGKTPEQKEKILKALAMKGLPLPEGQSPSEKKLLDKVRADLGLPTEPNTKSIRDKHEQAAKAGLLQPLEGKTPSEKEKILKSLHNLGIPLPEGRTPSEKVLIAKVKTPPSAPPIKAESLPTVTSDKIRKAKAAGLFTPLRGKTPEQKEKILQGLAETGLPLPEGKTPSEKALINKIKKESGIPDKTPSEKLRKAKAAGLLTPLEGKSLEQKEKILRGRAAAGLPLPMYKTPSEKALLQKIKDDTGYVSPSPSERLRKAKAAGLVTPLKGKTPSMKEKILKGMKAAGVPFPEGETPSENKLISKLISRPPSVTQSEKSMLAKARTPPEGKTPSEKSIISKAKAAGLFTPITGKAPAEKERILKGLAEAGFPLPVGKTASEKDLIKKIRTEAGLPIKPTPSEKKGKIRVKEKKVGVSASKRAAELQAESFQDIIKTTACDRGCGCDKKKIKFKHSYVKIRVTSPDISSLCDCPDECIPGVKSGAFIDNEGIKVTVGSAVGIPSYSMDDNNQVILDEIVSNTDLSKTRTNSHNNLDDSKKTNYKVNSELGLNNSNKMNYIINASISDMSYSTTPFSIQCENIHAPSSIAQYQGRASKSDRIVESLRGLQASDNVYIGPTSNPNSASSFETILIIKNDMSLSTSTSNSMDSISLISVIDSSISSSSAYYSGYQSTNDLLSINSLDGPTNSNDSIDHPATVGKRAVPQQYTVLRMSQLEASFGNKNMRKSKENTETEDPIVLFNQLPSKLDVSKIMLKIMSKKRYADASSVFIVVPMSDDDEEQGSSNCVHSITTIPSIECHFTASTISIVDPDLTLRTPSFTKHEEQVCGKGKKFYMQEISSNDTDTMFQNESLENLQLIGKRKKEFCQSSTQNEKAHRILEKPIPGGETDTTADRPRNSYNAHYAPNVIPRQITPVFRKGNCFSWFHLPGLCSCSPEPPAYYEPSFCSVPLYCPRKHGPRQQIQISKSPSLCCCPPDDFKVERKRSAKVQKPSIQSTCPEADTRPKKAAKIKPVPPKRPRKQKQTPATPPVVAKKAGKSFSWFRQSPAPSRPRQSGRNQQKQITKSPSVCSCSPKDLKEQRIRTAKVQKPSIESMRPEADTRPKKPGNSFSWSRLCKRKSSATCHIPVPCIDHSVSPMPPNRPRKRARSQKSQTPPATPSCECPPDDLKLSACKCPSDDLKLSACKCPSAVLKQSACKCPSDDKEESRKLSVKVQKPSIVSKPPKKPGNSFSWSRLCKRKSSVTCLIPGPCIDHSVSPMPSNRPRKRARSQKSQTPPATPSCECPPDDLKLSACKCPSAVLKLSACKCPSTVLKQSACKCPSDDKEESRKLSVKVQKPSIVSKPPKKAGVKLSRSRSPSSPVPPKLPRQPARSQQIQTTASLCSCPVTRKTSGKSFSWSRIYKPTASVACDTPAPCIDHSVTPVPSKRSRKRARSQKSQTPPATPSCECPPDNYKKKKVQKSSSIKSKSASPKKADSSRNRQIQTPPLLTSCVCPPQGNKEKKKKSSKAKKSPSIVSMRASLERADWSCSPMPSTRSRQCGRSQQNQTPESLPSCICSQTDDREETRYPSAEPVVRKRAGKSFSWSRICKPTKSVGCDIPECFDPSLSPVPPFRARHHGRTQQNQTPPLPASCVCSRDNYEDSRYPCGKVQKSSSIESLRAALKKCGESFSWSRIYKRMKSVACNIPECFDHSLSPVPSNRPCHNCCTQQNQTPPLPASCVCSRDNYEDSRYPCGKVQKSSSIEPIRAALKECGNRFSWSRLIRKNKACDTPMCFDPGLSPVPLNRPSKRGWSQQNQTPAPPPSASVPRQYACPPDDYEETSCGSYRPRHRHHGRRQQHQTAESSCICLPENNPSIESICVEEGSSGFRSTPEPPRYPHSHCRTHQTQTPVTLGYDSNDLKETRNPSAKVQKPSIESMCHEGRTAPKKAGVGSGWCRLPCICKDPKIPTDLESTTKQEISDTSMLSPQTSKHEEIKTVEVKVDKSMRLKELESPKDLESQKNSNINSKLLANIQRSIFKMNETLKSQIGQQALSKAKDSGSPKDLKSAEISEQKKGESKCVCKEDKPRSPKDLEIPKTSILKESKINPMLQPEPAKKSIRLSDPIDQQSSKPSKEDESMRPKELESPTDLESQKTGNINSKLLANIQKSISKINETLKSQVGQQASKEPKDLSRKSPKDLESQKTSKINSKLLANIQKSISEINETLKSQVGQPAPSKAKDPSSPEDLKSPDTSKQKKRESVCVCNEDKHMSPKDLEIPKTSILKESKIHQMPQPETAKKIIGLSDPIGQQSSKTSKEEKSMTPNELESPTDLESQKTSNINSKLLANIQKSISEINETLKSQVGQPASSKAKDSSSPKDLKSRETSKQKKLESKCACNEDKPMSPKDLEIPKTSILKESKINPMPQPEPAKKITRLSDPIDQQSSKPSKEDKSMRPKELESPKDLESQKTSDINFKLLANIQKSISKINETVKSQMGQQDPSKPKDPETPKEFKSLEISKQKEGESVSVYNEDKRHPKSPETSKLKEGIILCGCQEDKTMTSKDLKNTKDPKGPTTNKLKEDIIICGCKEDKTMTSKDLKSTKDPKSPTTNKLKEDIIICGCKEDKTMTPKDLKSTKDPKSPTTNKLKEDIIICGCKEDKPKIPNDIKSPKTSKLKKDKNICGCKEDNLMPSKELESLKDLLVVQSKMFTSIKKSLTKINETLKAQVSQKATSTPKDPSSPKYLKSPQTSRQKKGEPVSVYTEDKPMSFEDLKSPKDLESKKTSNIKSKLFTSIKRSISKINETLKSQVGQQASKEPKDLSRKSPKDLESQKTSNINSKLLANIQKSILEINKTLKSQVGQQAPSKAKDSSSPKDLKSRDTSKEKKLESKCACNEDEPVSPKDLEIPKTSMLKESKINPMPQPEPAKKITRLSDPIDQQSSKPSKKDKELVIPKELESQKTSKINSKLLANIQKSISEITEILKRQVGQQALGEPKDPSSPKDLKSPQTSKQKEIKTACECKEEKPMGPKELESPKDLKSPQTSKQKERKIACECVKDKPEPVCVCNEDKPMRPKELESPKDLKNPQTSKQKEVRPPCECVKDKPEPVCVCNGDKPLSLKNVVTPERLNSFKTSKQKERELVCVCNVDKPLCLKDLNRPKDPKGPKTSKQKERKTACNCIEEKPESVCMCNEDKPMNPKILKCPKDLKCLKDSKSPKTSKQKERKTACECFEEKSESVCVCNGDKPMSPKVLKCPKDLKCLKDLKNPKTSEQKERNTECKCKEDNQPTKQKGGKLLCQCKVDKTEGKTTCVCKKYNQGGKVSCECEEDKTKGKIACMCKKYNQPTKQKGGEISCECKEDKTKGKIACMCKKYNQPTKKKAGKLLCECDEDKMKGKVSCKCDTKTKPGSQSLIPRQKRCPPLLPPVILGLPPVETSEGYLYEGIGPSCKWLDTGEIKKLRSELTQSTSGFKLCKRKKRANSGVHEGKVKVALPEDNNELDFGEAIRYFATMNPERFQQLMQDELESQLDAEENKVEEAKNLKKKIEKDKRKLEKARKKAEKEMKKGIINKTTTTNIDNMPISYETTEFPDERESSFPQGFKFSVAVKDGPTGLAGVDCSEMNQNFFMVKRHK